MDFEWAVYLISLSMNDCIKVNNLHHKLPPSRGSLLGDEGEDRLLLLLGLLDLDQPGDRVDRLTIFCNKVKQENVNSNSKSCQLSWRQARLKTRQLGFKVNLDTTHLLMELLGIKRKDN